MTMCFWDDRHISRFPLYCFCWSKQNFGRHSPSVIWSYTKIKQTDLPEGAAVKFHFEQKRDKRKSETYVCISFMCTSVNILFTYINKPRAKRRHQQIPILDVTYYERAMGSRPVHVRGTEGSLCTCAFHCSKDTLFLSLYFRQMSDVFWIQRSENFVSSPRLTIASGVSVVPMFDGTELLSFQGKSARETLLPH